jgi:hypothetical protein
LSIGLTQKIKQIKQLKLSSYFMTVNFSITIY